MEAREYLRESIVDPSAHLVDGYNDLMPPNFDQVLTPAEVDSLIDFLLTLQ
jgi:hypothetical protein